MSEKKRKIIRVIGIAIIILGVCGLLYPVVGNWINSLQHRNAVTDYQGQVSVIDDAAVQEMLKAAHEYNDRLYARSSTIADLTDEQRTEYESMLHVSAAGIMGYVDIPKIHVSLPIYHGTAEEVLQVGVGHLEGSSLPVGGPNTHAVLTGHSGLPSSKLFTDLDQMDIGDTFTITVLNTAMTYEVDDIQVVLPEDAKLEIEEGGDACTLITCTPIGANTHRLLVHAVRSEDGEPSD